MILVPSGTCSPAAGSVSMTWSLGASDSFSTKAATRLADSIVARAVERSWPTTAGTDVIGLPVETVMVTVAPGSTNVSRLGSCLTTLSRATSASATYSGCPTASPASPMAARACASVIPIRSGTCTCSGESSKSEGSRNAAPTIRATSSAPRSTISPVRLPPSRRRRAAPPGS